MSNNNDEKLSLTASLGTDLEPNISLDYIKDAQQIDINVGLDVNGDEIKAEVKFEVEF